jgi:hypothetical protein
MTTNLAIKAPESGTDLDVADQAGEIIDLARQLATLLAAETRLVREMRVAEIAPLQAEKVALTRRYQAALKGFAATPGLPGLLPPLLRAHLTVAAERLAQQAAENEHALRVGRAATDQLIAAVAMAIRSKRPTLSGYTAHRAPPRSAPVAGISVNRSL